MKEDLIDIHEGVLDKQLHYEWPEGRAIVKVDGEKGLHQFVIDKLGLKISVQLVPFCSPTMATSGITDSSGLPLRPMMVWVVDITETTETVCCFSCWVCCRSKKTWEQYWDLHPEITWAKKEQEAAKKEDEAAKKEQEEALKRKEEAAKGRKQSYKRDAHSRVPLLITYEVK